MSKSSKILVLHASQRELRLVQAKVDRDRIELSHPCSFWPARGRDETPAISDVTVLDALSAHVAQQGWIGCDLLCLLSGSSIACQFYDMPRLNGVALQQAVRMKLGQQLHFNVNEAIVSEQRVPTPDYVENNQMRIGVIAAHRDVVNAAIALAERVGLNLVGLSAASAALTHMAQETFNNGDGLHAILHFDEMNSTLLVFDGSAPVVTTELPIGAADLTAALMRPIISGDDVIQLDEERAIALRNEVGIPAPGQGIPTIEIKGERLLPLLEPALQKLTKQLTQWLTFASTNANRAKVKGIRLVGPGAGIPGLAETVASRTNIETKCLSWMSAQATLSGAASDTEIEGYGSAVAGVRYARRLPDLMPAEVRRQERVRRIRKTISISGPALAAALLGWAFMFDEITAGFDAQIASARDPQMKVQTVCENNQVNAARQRTVRELQQVFTQFSQATPRWLGVFKELAAVLPPEFKAKQIDARILNGEILLTVTGEIFETKQGRGIQDITNDVLGKLDKSVFFEKVMNQGLNLNSEGQGMIGTLTAEMVVRYPKDASAAPKVPAIQG